MNACRPWLHKSEYCTHLKDGTHAGTRVQVWDKWHYMTQTFYRTKLHNFVGEQLKIIIIMDILGFAFLVCVVEAQGGTK